MKKIFAMILCVVMAMSVFTSCGKKAVTMDDILNDTNMVVGTISTGGMNAKKVEIYAYEILYLMNVGYATPQEAFDSVKEVKILQLKAIENGVELDDNAMSEVDSQLNQYIEQFGSKEAFEEQLKTHGVTYDQFYEITKMSQQAVLFQEKMVELGEFVEVTDEEAKTYFNERFLKAKHILLSTMDMETNQAIPDEEKEAKKAKAEEIVNAIKEGAAFEDYASLSEDPGSESSPDGYVFAKVTDLPDDSEEKNFMSYSGLVMVEEFEKGTLDLAVDGVSGIVESQYGYHIIKRLPLTDTDYTNNSEIVKSIKNNQKFVETVAQWEKEYKVEAKEDVLKVIDIEKFRETLPATEPEPSPAPQTAPVPEETPSTEGETEAAPAAPESAE